MPNPKYSEVTEHPPQMNGDLLVYTDQLEKKAFDWNAFLDKKDITEEEWHDAHHLSTCWITCACGNQCASIPRDHEGAPIDSVLKSLGNRFCEAIADRQPWKAKYCLSQIEARSTLLIENKIEVGLGKITELLENYAHSEHGMPISHIVPTYENAGSRFYPQSTRLKGFTVYFKNENSHTELATAISRIREVG